MESACRLSPSSERARLMVSAFSLQCWKSGLISVGYSLTENIWRCDRASPTAGTFAFSLLCGSETRLRPGRLSLGLVRKDAGSFRSGCCGGLWVRPRILNIRDVLVGRVQGFFQTVSTTSRVFSRLHLRSPWVRAWLRGMGSPVNRRQFG